MTVVDLFAGPATSTDGWHQSADGIRWATVQWLAFREEMAA